MSYTAMARIAAAEGDPRRAQDIISRYGPADCQWQSPKVLFRISDTKPPNFRYKFRIIGPNPRESTR
jgi:hypothetical protein